MWQVWIASEPSHSQHEGHASFRWKGGKFHTYREAYAVVAKALKAKTSDNKPKYYDMSISSRIQLFSPHHTLTPDLQAITSSHNMLTTYTSENLEWCGRCRRPTMFEWAMRSHHALRSSPAITTDDPYRCFYCGIRKVAMPRYTYPKAPKEALTV